jgi:hypothetical protein
MTSFSNNTDNTHFESHPTNTKNNSANTKLKRRQSTRPSLTTLKQSFSEKLGSDLAAGLIKESKSVGESLLDSLNLVDRVAYAKSSTAKTATTTTTTTTTETSTTIKEEEVILGSESISDSPNIPTSQDGDKWSSRVDKTARNTFYLNDFAAIAALEELIKRHGRVSHMGILDNSYTFFITKDRRAALYYKVKNKIAVVGGDPLCKPDLFPHILSEFAKYRKKQGWGIVFLGAGETFVEYVKSQNWTTMCFATERVLNPMTNSVLHGNAGKSITRTNKNLMDPNKEGIMLHVYTPRHGHNPALQEQLVKVYEEWRDHRNSSSKPQAYITVYDPFALPDLMTYLYSKDRNGVPNGFAALRMLGANNGYHLDPYVASPGAPKGITDLLLYGAMALLNTAKISYLSLGYEPLYDLGEITGMPKRFEKISRKFHQRIFQRLCVSGKKDYHDKFQPDESQQSNLYLVFPPGVPSLRHMAAIVHVANIKLLKVIWGKKVKREGRGERKIRMVDCEKGSMEKQREMEREIERENVRVKEGLMKPACAERARRESLGLVEMVHEGKEEDELMKPGCADRAREERREVHEKLVRIMKADR